MSVSKYQIQQLIQRAKDINVELEDIQADDDIDHFVSSLLGGDYLEICIDNDIHTQTELLNYVARRVFDDDNRQ